MQFEKFLHFLPDNFFIILVQFLNPFLLRDLLGDSNINEPNDTLEHCGQYEHDDHVAEDEEQQDDIVDLIVFEGVVPGYHRPACLCEDLHEVELGSDEAFEVGELVVHSIACCGFSGSVVEDLHADDAEDVVDYHEERHEAGGDGDDNDDSAQHLLEVLHDLRLFVHQLILADDLEEFPEPDDPQELEHGGVDDVAGERSNEEADDDGGAVHRIPLSIEIILQPIADNPDEYIQQKHIRENAI